MTDQVESLSDILAAETTSIVDTSTDTTITPAEPEAGQPRDEVGRFAPKAPDAPVVVPPQPEEQHAPADGKTVPIDVMTAVRSENRELRQQIQRLTEAVNSQQRPATPPAPVTPQQKRELWDDPDGFVADRLTPFQQQQAELNARLSHVAAVQEFGRDTVVAAHKAMNDAIEAGTLSRDRVNAQLSKSNDPVGDIVRWSNAEKAKANMNRIGNDPDAWLNAEIEKKLADPAFQAQVIERARTAAQQPNRSPAPAAPPPTLTRLPGGSGNGADGVPSLGDILKGG